MSCFWRASSALRLCQLGFDRREPRRVGLRSGLLLPRNLHPHRPEFLLGVGDRLLLLVDLRLALRELPARLIELLPQRGALAFETARAWPCSSLRSARPARLAAAASRGRLRAPSAVTRGGASRWRCRRRRPASSAGAGARSRDSTSAVPRRADDEPSRGPAAFDRVPCAARRDPLSTRPAAQLSRLIVPSMPAAFR